jgi:hypothetical protein
MATLTWDEVVSLGSQTLVYIIHDPEGQRRQDETPIHLQFIHLISKSGERGEDVDEPVVAVFGTDDDPYTPTYYIVKPRSESNMAAMEAENDGAERVEITKSNLQEKKWNEGGRKKTRKSRKTRKTKRVTRKKLRKTRKH